MTADMRLEELGVSDLDEPPFTGLLDELPAGRVHEPDSVAVARETIELAYLVAVQHLAPRPRAVLILRDVLGWPAKDVAIALLRWSSQPARRFVWTAVSLTVVSLVLPLVSGADMATITALLGLHLVAAAVMIPALARSLRARTD